MKTARYLFTVIAFGSLLLGRGYADEPSKHTSEQDAREKHATSDRPSEHSLLPEKSNKTIPINIPLKHAPGSEFHPFVLKKTAPAANEVLMKTKTENHSEPIARLPIGGGTTAPRPGLVLARSSTTVTAIGGLSSGSAKHSTAMVDGAAFKPKP